MSAVERSARGELVIAAEAQLGISDFDLDNEGWAQVARPAPVNGFDFELDPPIVAIEYHKGCKTLQPARTDTVRAGQTRLFTTSTAQSLCEP